MMKCANLPVMVLATLVGALIGEFCLLEKALMAQSRKSNNYLWHRVRNRHTTHLFKVTSLSLYFFCASGTGIFGAMHEGMTGDPNILIAKSFLDFFHCHNFRLFAWHRRFGDLRTDVDYPVNACRLRHPHSSTDYAGNDGRL